MEVRGAFEISNNDIIYNNFADNDKYGLLVGNYGNDMWDCFKFSNEYLNNIDDPLDNWVENNIKNICENVDFTNIYYPSCKPYLPFSKIALNVDDVVETKFKTLVHNKYGSWHGYRTIICFDKKTDYQNTYNVNNSIFEFKNFVNNIDIKNVCPADAFNNNYDFLKCVNHVYKHKNLNCYNNGCLIRQKLNHTKYEYEKKHNHFYFNQIFKKYIK